MKYYHNIRVGSFGIIRVPSSLPESLAPFVFDEARLVEMASFRETVREVIVDRR